MTWPYATRPAQLSTFSCLHTYIFHYRLSLLHVCYFITLCELSYGLRIQAVRWTMRRSLLGGENLFLRFGGERLDAWFKGLGIFSFDDIQITKSSVWSEKENTPGYPHTSATTSYTQSSSVESKPCLCLKAYSVSCEVNCESPGLLCQ